jgi:hypothetical protein
MSDKKDSKLLEEIATKGAKEHKPIKEKENPALVQAKIHGESLARLLMSHRSLSFMQPLSPRALLALSTWTPPKLASRMRRRPLSWKVCACSIIVSCLLTAAS